MCRRDRTCEEIMMLLAHTSIKVLIFFAPGSVGTPAPSSLAFCKLKIASQREAFVAVKSFQTSSETHERVISEQQNYCRPCRMPSVLSAYCRQYIGFSTIAPSNCRI